MLIGAAQNLNGVRYASWKIEEWVAVMVSKRTPSLFQIGPERIVPTSNQFCHCHCHLKQGAMRIISDRIANLLYLSSHKAVYGAQISFPIVWSLMCQDIHLEAVAHTGKFGFFLLKT